MHKRTKESSGSKLQLQEEQIKAVLWECNNMVTFSSNYFKIDNHRGKAKSGKSGETAGGEGA